MSLIYGHQNLGFSFTASINQLENYEESRRNLFLQFNSNQLRLISEFVQHFFSCAPRMVNCDDISFQDKVFCVMLAINYEKRLANNIEHEIIQISNEVFQKGLGNCLGLPKEFWYNYGFRFEWLSYTSQQNAFCELASEMQCLDITEKKSFIIRPFITHKLNKFNLSEILNLDQKISKKKLEDISFALQQRLKELSHRFQIISGFAHINKLLIEYKIISQNLMSNSLVAAKFKNYLKIDPRILETTKGLALWFNLTNEFSSLFPFVVKPTNQEGKLALTFNIINNAPNVLTRKSVAIFTIDEIKELTKNPNQEIQTIGRLLLDLDEAGQVAKDYQSLLPELFNLLRIYLVTYRTQNNIPPEYPSILHISKIEKQIIQNIRQEMLDRLTLPEDLTIKHLETLIEPLSLEYLKLQVPLLQKWYENILPQQVEEYQLIWEGLTALRDKRLMDRVAFIKTYMQIDLGGQNFNLDKYKEEVKEFFSVFCPEKLVIFEDSQNINKSTRPVGKNKKSTKKSKGHKSSKKASSVSTRTSNTSQAQNSEKPRDIKKPHIIAKKTPNEPVLPPLSVYDERVLDWFEDEPKALVSKNSYKSLNMTQKVWQHFCHGFTRNVDAFWQNPAYSMSYQRNNSTTGLMDNCYCIPGEVSFQHKKIRGIFVACESQKDRLFYHRYFHQASNSSEFFEILEKINRAYWEVDFPSLLETSNILSLQYISTKDLSRIKAGYFNTIIIDDKKFGCKITLFRYPKLDIQS